MYTRVTLIIGEKNAATKPLHTISLRMMGCTYCAAHTDAEGEGGAEAATSLVALGALLDVWLDGVAPDEVALAHEVEAVVGEVGAKATLVVNEQGVEVDPRDTLAVGDLFEQGIGLDDDVFTPLEQFPLAHVVVEGEQALEVNLGSRGALLDHDDELLHRTGDAVGTNIVGDIVDSAHDEQFLGLPLDDGTDAIDEALDDVADDATVLDVAVAHQLVELAAVGEAVAEHDDVLLADGQLVEQGGTTCIVGVLVGLLGQSREAHECHHGQDCYSSH